MLPTFVDRRRASADAVALLHEQFGDLVLAGGIPRSARFDAASLAGVPVALTAPRSVPAIAYGDAAAALAAALESAPKKTKATRRPDVKRFVRADMRDALRKIRRTTAETAESGSRESARARSRASSGSMRRPPFMAWSASARRQMASAASRSDHAAAAAIGLLRAELVHAGAAGERGGRAAAVELAPRPPQQVELAGHHRQQRVRLLARVERALEHAERGRAAGAPRRRR